MKSMAVQVPAFLGMYIELAEVDQCSQRLCIALSTLEECPERLYQYATVGHHAVVLPGIGLQILVVRSRLHYLPHFPLHVCGATLAGPSHA